MDNRPIGVFDSGLGGLSCVKEIMKVLPNESIVYFGDTSRVPYGNRSKEIIIKYTYQDIKFLLSKNIKAIVVACGTISSVAINEAKKSSAVPLIGVLESAVNSAVKVTKNNNIGVLGTIATINSMAYEKALLNINNSLKITNKACPLFVPLVENGYFNEDNQISYLVAQQYLEPLIKAKVDTIILGCTHYPLLKKIISKIMGSSVTLIDAGKQTALTLSKMLAQQDMCCQASKANYSYFVSDGVESFTKNAIIFLENDLIGKVEKIDIELC